ncbi:MAG: dihydrofolate reductase family protein, partial [Geodermatophilaceae bacterium]|nr:dihydrofolate reductase family protein [Geodermatophilaceae bacterium]
RHDNPRLLVRTAALREQRRRRGLGDSPMKVTVTEGGCLDPGNNFFTTGDSEKLVYCASRSVARVRSRLAGVATVVDAGESVDPADLAGDLHTRGVRRLMVEGGGRIHTQFLTRDLADELHLVVAPFFVGDPRAHRFVGTGAFPWNPGHRAHLAETRQIGDVVLLRYALSHRFAGVS